MNRNEYSYYMIRNTLYEYSSNTLVITFTFYRIIFWDFGTIINYWAWNQKAKSKI